MIPPFTTGIYVRSESDDGKVHMGLIHEFNQDEITVKFRQWSEAWPCRHFQWNDEQKRWKSTVPAGS